MHFCSLEMNMNGKILLVAFLVTQFCLCQVFCAPNCDLRRIFRTPRDFDQFELIERSNFDHDKPQDIRLKEDTKPYANAQILLRIGGDNDNAKKSEEPCIPLSQLTKQLVQKEVTPQVHPMIYQQHLNPYHTQGPFAFPHCLYYDALGALCSHLLPLVKDVLGKGVKAKSLLGTIAVENKPENTHLKEVNDIIKFSEETSLNPDDTERSRAKKEEGSAKAEPKESKVNPDQETEKPVGTNEDNECAHEQHEHRKLKDDNLKHKADMNVKKTSKRHVHKKSNIQKIPADGQVHIKSLVDEDSNEAMFHLNGIKLHQLRMSIKRDGIDEDEPTKEKNEKIKLTDVKESNISSSVNKTSATNDTDAVKLLKEALIPVSCLSCDNKEVKNVVTYPIFNKPPGDQDEKIQINIENCGCLNTIEQDPNFTHNHGPFTVDMDDLALVHGQPVAQASLIRNMAPKFLRDIVTAKTLSHYLPVVREEPKVTLMPYSESFGNVEVVPHRCPGCMCEECICNILRPNVYEEQPRLVIVEQPYEEEVVRVVPSIVHRQGSAPLPSFLSRQMSKPLAIYDSAVGDSSQDILLPVDVMPVEGIITQKCSSCAPYVGELNES